MAKRDLKAGETLDDYGMFMTYGEAVNVHEMSAGRYLPEGLVTGCRLLRNIRQGAVIRYDDVELPQAGLPTGSAPSSTATSAARAGSKSGSSSRPEPSCSFGEVSAEHSRADLPSGRHSV